MIFTMVLCFSVGSKIILWYDFFFKQVIMMAVHPSWLKIFQYFLSHYIFFLCS